MYSAVEALVWCEKHHATIDFDEDSTSVSVTETVYLTEKLPDVPDGFGSRSVTTVAEAGPGELAEAVSRLIATLAAADAEETA